MSGVGVFTVQTGRLGGTEGIFTFSESYLYIK